MTIMNLAIQTARCRFISLLTLIALMMVSPMTAQSDELGIEILTAGQGEVAKVGQRVTVHYVGRLENGKEFDNSHKRGEPIQFNLGVGQVISGWDEGISMMKEGGQASLIIPPHLGYGPQGAGNVIPPNATLIFDVELVKIG